mmetsp:Transcript_23316/g.60795  ORF Transcript_23316/g.60795 Transcript_23316/m.60795 type:complete len:281 (-) Transcript_23316:45-887(-)
MFSQRTRDLHKAILAGNYDKVIQCLDVGPKRERKKVLDQVEGGGATPLTEAASRGHNRIVIALLDRGAAIDQESYYAGSALISACRANECDTAELLIARGADIEYRIRNRYQNGYTPLIMACQEGHLDAARLLLEHGANINEGGGRWNRDLTPLQITCHPGKVKAMQFLLDHEAYPNDWTLWHACYHGSVPVVRCLLVRGIAVTNRSRRVAQDKPEIKALLDAAAPPRKRQLAHWINRIDLHVVGPRGDHQVSARHRLLNCRHLARHLASFLLNDAYSGI